MWQIQWVLGLIPDNILIYIYNTFIVIGLIGYIGSKLASKFPFKYIPIIGQYTTICEILSVILLTLGAWCIGGYNVEMAWRDKTKEVESKIALAEVKSKEENIKIVNKVITKTEYYKERGADIVQFVDREITKYDNTCPIPNEVIKAHNDAAMPGDKK